MKIAFLFPGQGAQVPGMGKDFYDAFLVSKETFQQADDILEENLSAKLFSGSKELLSETKYSQTGIFVTSVAILRALREQVKDIVPFAAAGLSLGEYTALFASGRIGFREALEIVHKRALFMESACQKSSGAMAAVLGMAPEKILEVIEGRSNVWIANYNTPEQIVITGTKEGVESASLKLKDRGAKRVIPLAVQGAFHSPLMQSAKEALSPFLEKVELFTSGTGLVMNTPGDFVEDLGAIRKNLTQQVTESVRWYQGIEALEKRGVDLYLEMGPGKTLSAMNRKMGVLGKSVSVEKLADLEGAFREWEITCC